MQPTVEDDGVTSQLGCSGLDPFLGLVWARGPGPDRPLSVSLLTGSSNMPLQCEARVSEGMVADVQGRMYRTVSAFIQPLLMVLAFPLALDAVMKKPRSRASAGILPVDETTRPDAG